LIIGNAAQSLNPVAGQGFNLALRDVAALLEVLQGEESLGSSGFISAYKVSREKDRDNTIRFTDSLVKVFANTLTPLAHLRAGSLMMADLIGPLRQRFVRQGMGLNAQRRIKGGVK
jgi:2-octaprenyl-6-methoxyphenol hydroxylase